MKPRPLSRYLKRWERLDPYKDWIKEVEGSPNEFHCIPCRQTNSLSNMGVEALKSHMTSNRHAESTGITENTPTINSYFKPRSIAAIPSTPSDPRNENSVPQNLPSTSSHGLGAINNSSVPENLKSASAPVRVSSAPKKIDSFLVKDKITENEILWTMQTVVTHKSLHTAEADIKIIKKMASKDDETIQKMQLGKTKIGYTMLYGIAPFCENQLIEDLTECDFLSIAFDESLNKVVKKNQMDVHVRFWNKKTGQAETRYHNSCFLGRSRSCDLSSAFIKCTSAFDKKKFLQIEMDGPHVNWKFYNEYKSENPGLLELGSCGLHIVHGAFKDGMIRTEWDLMTYLRSLYYLFRDYPARRAIYIQYSGSDTFPQKFYGIRWVENIGVMERAIDVDPSVKKYVAGVTKDKIEPKCKSYGIVKLFSQDPLLLAKLCFLKSLASEVEPFLKDFQTDDPAVPFLYSALTSTITNIMERFMTSDSIKSLKTLRIADIQNQKNHLNLKDISLGFGTLKHLKKCKLKTEALEKFQASCKNAMIAYISKLLKRSPLTEPLTCAASCLDPGVIALDTNVAKKRLRDLLSILVENDRLSESMADLVPREYSEIISSPGVLEDCKSYSRYQKRIDHFWRDLVTDKHQNFMRVVKIICCLFHGNANVERGFSINSECLLENMTEKSVVAKRQVYDFIAHQNGLENFVVPKALILSARNAHSRYQEALKARREKKTLANEKKEKKRQRESEIKSLESQKEEARENFKKICTEADKKISLLRDE